MITILFIHQSSELYGSDKTLLLLLTKLDITQFKPIVILPFDGPLKKELEKVNITVVIAPVIKLYRKMFTPKNIVLLFKEIKKGIAIIDELNAMYKFDLIYSNTLAVLLGMIYSKKRGIKHIWHVHEIIESPRIFTKIFRIFLKNKINTRIVYNSVPTQNFWNSTGILSSKSQVISNGIAIPKKVIIASERDALREELFHSYPDEIIIALVGRISGWKGQLVLLKAFFELSKSYKNIKLTFVGSPPPNQEVVLKTIISQIEKYNISHKVSIIPFQKDIFKIWQSIDIAVVPSTNPEPFGLVAVEAMLAKKPVVASNHGGLTEIVVHEKTGYLVEPKNDKALFDAIEKLIKSPNLRIEFGKMGYQRAIHEFSVEKNIFSFEALFKSMVSGK